MSFFHPAYYGIHPISLHCSNLNTAGQKAKSAELGCRKYSLEFFSSNVLFTTRYVKEQHRVQQMPGGGGRSRE